MSFFSNFQSDKCPGPITGNPLNGMNEKVCLQAQKIFDACIKQTQLQNVPITLTDPQPPTPTYPLTFVSARTTNSQGVISNLIVDRLVDKPGCARVQCRVTIPIEVLYTDSAGVEGIAQSTLTLDQDVLLYVPAPSIMPYQITAEVSGVCTQGTYDAVTQGFNVNACVTIILKVAIDVQILVPTYGYCIIPPAQDYTQEVCAGFFELPLYPQGKTCTRSNT